MKQVQRRSLIGFATVCLLMSYCATVSASMQVNLAFPNHVLRNILAVGFPLRFESAADLSKSSLLDLYLCSPDQRGDFPAVFLIAPGHEADALTTAILDDSVCDASKRDQHLALAKELTNNEALQFVLGSLRFSTDKLELSIRDGESLSSVADFEIAHFSIQTNGQEVKIHHDLSFNKVFISRLSESEAFMDPSVSLSEVDGSRQFNNVHLEISVQSLNYFFEDELWLKPFVANNLPIVSSVTASQIIWEIKETSLHLKASLESIVHGNFEIAIEIRPDGMEELTIHSVDISLGECDEVVNCHRSFPERKLLSKLATSFAKSEYVGDPLRFHIPIQPAELAFGAVASDHAITLQANLTSLKLNGDRLLAAASLIPSSQ